MEGDLVFAAKRTGDREAVQLAAAGSSKARDPIFIHPIA